MKLSADKQSTKIVKRILKKTGMLTIPCQFQGFGDCVVRFVSVSESDKYNWRENKYARYINFEITLKKSGSRYSEDKIPVKRTWNTSTRLHFFKNRKYSAQLQINQMLAKTNIPLFISLSSIPTNEYRTEICGNITYKYID